MKADHSLKSSLIEFLNRGGTTLFVPRIELYVVNVGSNSVTVTDDGTHSFELVGKLGVTAELSEQIQNSLSENIHEAKIKLHRWTFQLHKAPNSKKQFLDITCKNIDVSKGKKVLQISGRLKHLTEIKEVKELLDTLNPTKAAHPSMETTAAPSRNTQTPVKNSSKKNASHTPAKRAAREEEPEPKSTRSTKTKSISRNPSVNKSVAALRTPQVPQGLRSSFKSKGDLTQMENQPDLSA